MNINDCSLKMVLNLMKNIYGETVFAPFGAASSTPSATPGCARGHTHETLRVRPTLLSRGKSVPDAVPDCLIIFRKCVHTKGSFGTGVKRWK